jgi:dipeptidase E
MSLRLVLHSDQSGPQSRDADRRILAALAEGTPRIGYISSSPDPDRMFFKARTAYYADLGAQLDVYVDELSVSEKSISQLHACDAVHLSGGNTFTFAQWLGQTGLFEGLVHYAVNGGLLIGVSAGAIMLTKSVASAALCGDVRPPEVVEDTGLSLVQFGFWPHFQGNVDRLSDVGRFLQEYETVYACPDGGALLVNGARVECIGQVEVLRREAISLEG